MHALAIQAHRQLIQRRTVRVSRVRWISRIRVSVPVCPRYADVADALITHIPLYFTLHALCCKMSKSSYTIKPQTEARVPHRYEILDTSQGHSNLYW